MTVEKKQPLELAVGENIIVGGDLREVLAAPHIFCGYAVVRCRRYVPGVAGSAYTSDLNIRPDYAVTVVAV